jgi:DNA-directed RNA polymerase alpha subunit
VTRVENCLVCNDILLVKDLEKLSAKDLNNIKNFGKESFRFVEYACNRLKIKLRKGEGRP